MGNSGQNKGVTKSIQSFNDALGEAPDDSVTESLEIARMHLMTVFSFSAKCLFDSILGVLCILQEKQLFFVMGKVLCIPFCKTTGLLFYSSDKRLLFQRLYLHVDGETW